MFCAKFSADGIYFRFLASLSSMKVMRQFGRMLDWAGQHPATALMILLTLWAAALAVRAKLTEHARFNRTFADAVWDWSQAVGGKEVSGMEPDEYRWFRFSFDCDTSRFG